ncbi:MAG: hypothetical protein NTY74_09365 [Ignavibacteriae bacterium]|nr:hypothetical protein [Ignavibacteriota bacterium]
MKRLFIVLTCVFQLLISHSVKSQWVLQNSNTTDNIVDISVVSDNVAWGVGKSNMGLFVTKTTNAGANWTKILASGIDPQSEVPLIAAFDENNAVIGTNKLYNNTTPRIYRTTNGGQSWSTVFTLNSFLNGIRSLNSTTGYFQGDPVGGRFEFYRTTNKGATWDSTGLYAQSIGGESGSIYSLNANQQVISFGTTNTHAVYFSTNGGANWQRKVVNSSFIDIPHTLFKDGMNGIVGDLYLLYKTTNGGNNWTPLPFNGVHYIQGIAGVGNHIYVGRRYVIYYSSNFGDSWARQDSSVANIGLWAFEGKYSNGKLNMWGVGEAGRVSYYAFPVGIKQLSQTVPDNFKLNQNYPNPFNPSTVIRFNVSGFPVGTSGNVYGKKCQEKTLYP